MGVDFHFLSVGHGDCTIIHWPERKRGGIDLEERIMMLDIYHHENHEDYEDVLDYYKRYFTKENGTIKPIFRFVCSHPHQDHLCGLNKLFNEHEIDILNFWDLKHSFEPSDFEGHPTHNDDWSAYKNLSGENSPATVIRPTRETVPGQYWNEEGDRIKILAPSDELYEHAHFKEDGTEREPDKVEIDEMSFSLLIEVNKRSVILAGDGRATPVWSNIYENCPDLLASCSILKAGHHGHECSFHEDSLRLMSPEYIIFSNSFEQDRDNGADSKYSIICPRAKIFKTYEGSIVASVPFSNEEDVRIERVE